MHGRTLRTSKHIPKLSVHNNSNNNNNNNNNQRWDIRREVEFVGLALLKNPLDAGCVVNA